MTRELVRQIHLWLGVALCIPFVALGLTGSVLVWDDELRDLFAATPIRPAASGAAHSVADIIAAAQAVAPPGFAPIAYTVPEDPRHAALVRFAPARQSGPGGELRRVAVDPVSLAASAEREPDFLRQVFFLHSTLLLKNREGRQLVGWFGVAMLVMAVSGIVNWWPRRRQWRAAFGISRQAIGYRLLRELHGAAGIWSLLVFVAVSFGGVALAFPESVHAIVAAVLPARDLRAAAAAVRVEPIKGAQPAGVDQAIAVARAYAPDAVLRQVLLPRRPDQPFRVMLLRPGQDSHAVPVSVLVDPWRSQAVGTLDPRDFSAGETLLAWQHVIHSGQGLGLTWKLLVFLCGLLPALFAASGITMCQLRRRRFSSATNAPESDLADIPTARRAGE